MPGGAGTEWRASGRDTGSRMEAGGVVQVWGAGSRAYKHSGRAQQKGQVGGGGQVAKGRAQATLLSTAYPAAVLGTCTQI